jgi:predicted RNA-binding Zn-ribbon protein involved in translation (DUF1610 family)
MVYMISLLIFVVSLNMLINGINMKSRGQAQMNTIERETRRRDFTAMIDCPKCGAWAIHWLRGGRLGRITRQCRECGYEWKQK